MGLAVIIICCILLAIILTVTIVFAIKYARGPKLTEIEDNLPIVWNFAPELSDGKACGLEITNIQRKNGHYYVELLPLDNHKKSTSNEAAPIKVKEFVVCAGCRIPFPRGLLSAEREIVWYFPKNTLNLSKKLKDTWLGEQIKDASTIINALNDQSLSIREGQRAITKMVKDHAMGELSRDTLSRIHEETEESRKIKEESITIQKEQAEVKQK